MNNIRLVFAGLAVAMFILASLPASAQPRGDNLEFGWGPGTMMGPGPMWGPSTRGRGRFGQMCDPRMAGFAGYRISRIERDLKLTDEQQKLLAEVRTASVKAADVMTDVCRVSAPTSVPQRLEFMQKRTEAMLEAIKISRAAFEPFYASLTGEQKVTFDRAGPRPTWWHRFWRGT